MSERIKKQKDNITIRSSAAEYLTFVASTGDSAESIEMRYEDENIWLTQKMMAELYNVDVRTINYHIGKVFEDSELEERSTIRKFRIVQSEGNRQISREVNHYNLQMIIAVGFKVNNERAVQFRKWANAIVKDYTIKGWVMDEERLKNGGTVLTEKYFEEQGIQVEVVKRSELHKFVILPRRWVVERLFGGLDKFRKLYISAQSLTFALITTPLRRF